MFENGEASLFVSEQARQARTRSDFRRARPNGLNFGRTNQLTNVTKKKDRFLIRDLISCKLKYGTKEARLILQLGIYIFCYHPLVRETPNYNSTCITCITSILCIWPAFLKTGLAKYINSFYYLAI